MKIKIYVEDGELEEMGLSPEEFEHALEEKLEDWYDYLTKTFEVVEE